MALTYESSGVDYGPLDAFKRACQVAAGTTSGALAAHGMSEPKEIRGESAYLIETPTEYWAHVEEGLGTKNLVADAVQRETGACFYRAIGIDTVATIVNDLITTGALPVAVAMHAGVGDTDWFKDGRRASELAAGFAEGCRQAGAVWSGGETPALRDIIVPGTIVLAGSAIGRIAPKPLRVQGDVVAGDAIVLLASSGVQTNGLTLCRKLAGQLKAGYQTRLASGRAYGEALLAPSVIYAGFVAGLQRAGVRAHYLAHITGHGWRKIMRLPAALVYRIEDVGPEAPEVFRFLMEAGPVTAEEAYGTFNMGAGFAAYVAEKDVAAVLAVAKEGGYVAWRAGTVVKEGDRKAVEIPSLGLRYDGSTLQVR